MVEIFKDVPMPESTGRDIDYTSMRAFIQRVEMTFNDIMQAVTTEDHERVYNLACDGSYSCCLLVEHLDAQFGAFINEIARQERQKRTYESLPQLPVEVTS